MSTWSKILWYKLIEIVWKIIFGIVLWLLNEIYWKLIKEQNMNFGSGFVFTSVILYLS